MDIHSSTEGNVGSCLPESRITFDYLSLWKLKWEFINMLGKFGKILKVI
jgi:hypothetical protein